jgi:hypothetical protein
MPDLAWPCEPRYRWHGPSFYFFCVEISIKAQNTHM